jgi:hypothetical protein
VIKVNHDVPVFYVYKLIAFVFVTGQRIVNVDTMETTVSSSGNVRGTQVTQVLTFVGEPPSKGVLHGIGRGMTMAAGSDIATFTGEGVGRFGSSGSISWRGSIFYNTSSTGSLSFLNNLVEVFEAEIDAAGNFSHKAWEWK